MIEALKARFPTIVGPDTKDICYATQNRQRAARELAKIVDVVLVVGAPNSSNSNRLREIAAESGVPSYLIEDADALDPRWLDGAAAVGITAGASAPAELVEALIDRLREIAEIELAVLPGVTENVRFRMPPQLADSRRLRPARHAILNEGSPWPFRCVKRSGSAPMCSGGTCAGVERYPLVLMLEPLFRCNLACAGCGKIDYPDAILNQRLSVAECLEAVDECGAPIVVLAGGEPLLHRDIDEIARGIIARKKFVYLCTNALLLEKKIDQFEPNPYFAWTVHLDGDREEHDRSVCQDGVYDRAVAAIGLAKARGFRVNINATLFDTAEPERVARFFDEVSDDRASTASPYRPATPMSARPTRSIFSTAAAPRNCSATSSRGAAGSWSFNQSSLFLDFLAGNQSYRCTPWGNPTRNFFGWQRPCYLLGEGYAKTFKELMEETDWDAYGTGNYEKCADCMVHSGYEATAVIDTVRHPLKAAAVALRGVRTEGEMAPEIPLDRPAPGRIRALPPRRRRRWRG